jgi:FkbM family methyltransferase
VETQSANGARRESRIRYLVKRVIIPVLSIGTYRKLLAWSKLRDFRSGHLREAELDLIPLLLEPGETAIDVGANHGMWTLAISQAVGDKGRVFSFEPMPETFMTLQEVVRRARLGNVEAIPKGCFEKSGRLTFAVPALPSGADDDMQARVVPDLEALCDEGQVALSENDVVALDEFMPKVHELALLKVDIEGAELFALRGARSLIRRYAPSIVCEIDPGLLAGYGLRPEDIGDLLEELGYSAYLYDAGEKRLGRAGALSAISHANIVFVHPSRESRLSSVLAR